MNILVLDVTTKTISVVLDGAKATTDPTYSVHYGDATSTTFVEGAGDGVLNGTTPVTVLAAPGASTRRMVKELTIYNADTVAVTATISLLNSSGSTSRIIRKTIIGVGQTYALSSDTASYDLGLGISTATAKTTPVDADRISIWDSVTALANYVTWANLKATLKTYLDTLYLALVTPGTSGNVLTSNGSAWVANPMSNRNAIINGAMDVWQRGTATLTNPANGTYFPDRFQVEHLLGDGTYNLLQSAETPSSNFPFQFSLQHDTTHIETAVAAGELSVIEYKIEGYDFKRFEGQTATLSFWVKAVKTGIYCVSLRNSPVTKSYVHEFTINASNTWEKKTVTLTFNSGGTFLYTNGVGLQIIWAVMCGSTLQIATANKDTWVAGNYIATDAQVNGMDSINNNFYLTGVQMELGSVATPFEFRPYEQELALCQRYCYAKTTTVTYETIGHGSSVSTSVANIKVNLPVTMRATPSVVVTPDQFGLYDGINVRIDATNLTISAVESNPDIAVVLINTGATQTAFRPVNLVGDAAGRTIIFTAEL